MKHLVFLIVMAALLVTQTTFAATRKPNQEKEKTKVSTPAKKAKVAKKSTTKKKVAKKKTNRKKVAKSSWNDTCQGLIDNSVKSTLQLEKSVQKQKKITQEEFEGKIQDELLVVQLNAWVCAVSMSTADNAAPNVEEKFFQDYSKQVQSRRL